MSNRTVRFPGCFNTGSNSEGVLVGIVETARTRITALTRGADGDGGEYVKTGGDGRAGSVCSIHSSSCCLSEVVPTNEGRCLEKTEEICAIHPVDVLKRARSRLLLPRKKGR
jgi:hypothetical protein